MVAEVQAVDEDDADVEPYRDWASHVVSCALVSTTKRRDTLLFETARSPMPAGSGSSARRYLRVVTPIAIASSVRASSGSRAAG